MATPQTAILSETGSAGLFLLLRVTDGDEAMGGVIRRCADLEQMASDLIDEVAVDNPGADLRTAVAFGSDFWGRLSPTRRPSLLKPFEPLNGKHSAPATGGDLLLHIHSLRPDLNFELGRRFLADLQDSVEVLDEVRGFRYLDSRDLTGFIDGTENPEGDERAQVALIGDENREFAGGSYVLVQRYEHSLPEWERLPVAEQEGVIGRTKLDSVELDEAVKPETAHISRVVIEEQGEELEILRHSMPYGEASGAKGLFFIAYSSELTIFEKMLARMFGLPGAESDGLDDRLLDFTTPVSGAFFFAPPREMLPLLR